MVLTVGLIPQDPTFTPNADHFTHYLFHDDTGRAFCLLELVSILQSAQLHTQNLFADILARNPR